jgi:hypothetical protein
LTGDVDLGDLGRIMTTRGDFSPDDWRLLARLPIEIGAAASVADEGAGSGTTRELLAAISTLTGGAMLLRHNQLVQAVFDDYKADGHGEAQLLELSQNPPPDLVSTTLEHASTAAAVLAAHANADDAGEFKLWLRGIASDIVTSSAKGGFLGIGGAQVTDEEIGFLDRLTSALALEMPAQE